MECTFHFTIDVQCLKNFYILFAEICLMNFILVYVSKWRHAVLICICQKLKYFKNGISYWETENILALHKSFVFRLLININKRSCLSCLNKQHGWAIKPKCCYWIKLHKGEQKDRTKTLAEFQDHILNDYIFWMPELTIAS